MSMTSPDRIELNQAQQERLEDLIRAGTTAQQLVERARIVMLAAAQWTNTKIAQRVGVCVDTVRKWRHRWCLEPGTASLGDAKRSGRPPSFTPVQVAAVKALACQPPEASGLPLSRWSCPDLAGQVVAEGIAASVSTSTVRRWLSEDAIKPWQYYYSQYPKPCMGGWGRRQLTVTPNGDALPCPAAQALPLPRASVREDSLARIWTESPLFQRFRGTDWMPDPCRSCDRREIDFGGCRCQAFQLTGDAARTDPVCHLSPDHAIVAETVRAANDDARPLDEVLTPRPQQGPMRNRVPS